MRLRRTTPERVRVVVPNVLSLDAVVARAVPGAAELALTTAPPLSPRFLHRRRAVVLPVQGEGRLEGMLLAVAGQHGGVRDDVLRVLEDVASTPGRRVGGRRDFARVDVALPVTMVPDGLQRGWLDGFARNLSAGGILVAGADVLELGDRLRMRVALEDDDLLDLVARVVREDARGLRGLRLEGLDDPARERIVRYVFARQRRALALRARAA